MVRLVSSRSALAADRRAEEELGYPPILLMEEAGIRLQLALENLLEREGLKGTVAYLIGPGNNGGDGLVMARQAHLRGTARVSVVEVLPPKSESCRWQRGVVESLGMPVAAWPSPVAQSLLASAAVWVDALWGAGLGGPLRPAAAEILGSLESLRAETAKPVLAVDVPSGLWSGAAPGEPVLRARWTLSPGWKKDFCFFPGLRELCGDVSAVPLAFPSAAEKTADLVEESDILRFLPPLSAQAHKGTRGHLALFGGAPGMTGALVLAARSAAAAGAGLVSLGTDEASVSLVAPQVNAFQVRTTAETLSRLPGYDAAVVGPGWGTGPDRESLFEGLWNSDLPLVVDADGLAVWASVARPPRKAPVVLTPHPGEFRRLGAGEPTVAAAQELARSRQVVVILKGAVTWIVGPQESRVWDGANPAMGTGGSGDCLAGVVGAFLARGLSGEDAAAAAVALHSLAGRDLSQRFGWFTADRFPEALGQRAAACMAAQGPL